MLVIVLVPKQVQKKRNYTDVSPTATVALVFRAHRTMLALVLVTGLRVRLQVANCVTLEGIETDPNDSPCIKQSPRERQTHL